MSTWHPEGAGRRYDRRARPKVGDIVGWDRRAWEVRHVSDADPTPEEANRLSGYREAYRDQMRPYRITLHRLYGKPYEGENDAGDIGRRVTVTSSQPFPVYPNGRVPLCSCHQEPWPCAEADQQAEAEKELKRAEKAMSLMPGCCPACEEPITSRQKSITFAGPNVTNPLAEGPTYHLRSKCYGSAAAYEEKWVAAEPGRPRSLLTLNCPGFLTVHHDGSAECHGRNGGRDCPSIHAQHRGYTACYLQSHGCPQNCPRAGHPGTRVANYPNDPRAVTKIEETR